MHPIPCAHCGINFMKQVADPYASNLCNNCVLREELRNPKKEVKMDTVNIIITCPKDVQAEIEEYCIAQGVTFSAYFLGLHEACNRDLHPTEIAFLPDAKHLQPDCEVNPKELDKHLAENTEKNLPKKHKGKHR